MWKERWSKLKSTSLLLNKMSLVMYNRNISYCKSCWCLLVQPSKEVHVSVTWSKVHWLSSIPSLEASGSNTSYCSNISPDGPRSCSLPTSHSSWPFHQRFLACLTSDPTRNSVLQLFTNKTLSLSFFLSSFLFIFKHHDFITFTSS